MTVIAHGKHRDHPFALTLDLSGPLKWGRLQCIRCFAVATFWNPTPEKADTLMETHVCGAAGWDTWSAES